MISFPIMISKLQYPSLYHKKFSRMVFMPEKVLTIPDVADLCCVNFQMFALDITFILMFLAKICIFVGLDVSITMKSHWFDQVFFIENHWNSSEITENHREIMEHHHFTACFAGFLLSLPRSPKGSSRRQTCVPWRRDPLRLRPQPPRPEVMQQVVDVPWTVGDWMFTNN